MKKILYVSTLCSPKMVDYLLKTASRKPVQSIQKFSRLLVEGFAKSDENCKVGTLTSVPVIHSSHSRRIWFLPSENVNRVKYSYAHMVNLPFLKNVMVYLNSFIKTFIWAISSIGCRRVVFCDALNLTIATAAMVAGKITRSKTVVIVTDMPHLTVSTSGNAKLIRQLRFWFNYKIISAFDGFVVLTRQLNDVVNTAGKPHIIMEGLVDEAMAEMENRLVNKAKEKIIIYAGGIYEIYGVKTLIDAFLQLKGEDYRFYIYGDGPMAKDMPDYCKKDSRIKYFGVVENAEVVKMQMQATLLLNPRPTSEELTKYSFPSKNIESMVSGTPLVTTNLPGMPQEYHPHVYLFNDETVEGMRETLQDLLGRPREELHEFGLNAKKFVLENKSNTIQAKRVLEFVEKEVWKVC